MKRLLFFLTLTIGLAQAQSTYTVTAADNAFLDSLQHDTFRYFWETANPKNGLIPDRAPRPRSVA